MMTLEEFDQAVEEEMSLLPDYVYKELNGGVLVDQAACMHPRRLADDLFILGTYSVDPIMGKQIVLYYGSFAATMQYLPDSAVRQQIRDTLRHEFRHHLETNAGLFGKGTLIEEDRNAMIRYFLRHKEADPAP